MGVIIGGGNTKLAYIYTDPVTGVKSIVEAGSGSAIQTGAIKGTGLVVGQGGDYSGLHGFADAITSLGSRIRKRVGFSQVVTATVGSNIVTVAGATFLSQPDNPTVGLAIPGSPNLKMSVGDLWKPDVGSRYYKVERFISDTVMVLHEPIAAGDGIATVSALHSFYYLDEVSILLLPGQHFTYDIGLGPGIHVTGISPRNTTLNEGYPMGANLPVGVLGLGENSLSNITFAPSPTWGDLDSFTSSGTIYDTLWAGSETQLSNLYINSSNPGGSHSGGALSLPIINEGTVTIKDCRIFTAKSPTTVQYGAATPTSANTRLNIINTEFNVISDRDSYFTGTENFGPGGFTIGTVSSGATIVTASISNCIVRARDRGVNAAASQLRFMGIRTLPRPGGDIVLDIVNTSIKVANTSTNSTPITGVLNNGGTINIRNSSIEVAGTSNPTGVLTNATGAITNITTTSIDAPTGVTNTLGATNYLNRGNVVNGAVI